jgi:TatD DNase family protein
MAEALRLSREDIERITRLNAQQLFRIGSPDAGQIAYPIRNSLYLNITNRCTNSCTFCVRNRTDFVKGHNLRLDHEPSYEEVIAAIKDPSAYVEVVFCGIGEPLLRLDLVKAVAIWLKKRGARVRLNTNGQGNLIWKRDIIPELVGLIDEVSVSLNAPTAEIYEQLCPSQFGPGTFASVKDFVRQAARLLPKVSVTAVAVPGLDISACRDVAQKELGVPLRVRAYNVVG